MGEHSPKVGEVWRVERRDDSKYAAEYEIVEVVNADVSLYTARPVDDWVLYSITIADGNTHRWTRVREATQPLESHTITWRGAHDLPATTSARIVRALNRAAVAVALADPPRHALDGRGLKRGEQWDAWTRAVAARLEAANCREVPETLTVAMLLEVER